MNREDLRSVLLRVAALERDARQVLARHESAPDRVLTLEQSYKALDQLSVPQDEVFREALRAVEFGLYRAAHVLAWAGFMDWLHGWLWENHRESLLARRSNWNLQAAEDLRDQIDWRVIDAGRDAHAYKKAMTGALHGLLNKRNECAHPSDYFPDLNETLGYVGELFHRVRLLAASVERA